MPFDLTVPANRRYVLVKWRGHATVAEIERSGPEALAFSAQQKVSKVLVDISEVENRIGDTDLYFRTSDFARLPGPRPRAALMGRPDQFDELTFIETVGINRGMPIKAFTNIDEAVRWLDNEPPSAD